MRNLPREQVADAVFMLSMEAHRQSELLRHAVRQRVEVETETSSVHDLATYVASDSVSTLRHHAADAPTLLGVLVQRERDVRFTVGREEAVALLAATLREQQLQGILEGLRLAGLLTEPAKDRHAGIGIQADVKQAGGGA
ncbi:hypothetical protein M2175_004037 [Bradyrhizobium elkanii]|uniref:hypothetical protein n=1 Tax=Bradyrhizobium TaxID=374 RepID=UPI00216A5CDB|nr:MULTISPECIES: hypothetical protein [Bradyrhizobium]MCS3929006.1 hypothetical protein [Bradyrhizobium elkanii]MCS3969562.1 hypothetical protein [Bradyrhizobium japonicum]